MSYFLYDHDLVITESLNPDTGNTVETREKIKRNLPSLTAKDWDQAEMLIKALAPQTGRECRHTKGKNTEVRDVFLTKVQGGPDRKGGRYRQLRIGVLYSGLTQDKETGEMRRWISFAPEGEEQIRRLEAELTAARAEIAKLKGETSETQTEVSEEAPVVDAAEQAQVTVENL
ncbi:MAG: hypothetical protein ACXABY_08980 [Candidatus Thorarchaeota archaeon]|jgi:hypothetical protein